MTVGAIKLRCHNIFDSMNKTGGEQMNKIEQRQ